MSKATTRQLLRQRRRSLSVSEQATAAQALCEQLAQVPILATPQRIGLYFPSDGEISPLTFANTNPQHHYYLPSLSTTEKRLLCFHPWHPQAPIQYNHLDVAEPVKQSITLDALQLNVVLMPLVGFDEKGTRLGMGGGFYDYTFRHMENTPYLIGVAHQCQYAETLKADPWDLPLHAVVTDKKIFTFR